MARKNKNRQPEEPKPNGRPPHVPDPVSRRMVTLGKGCRMNMEDIAAAINVSTETLNKHYKDELAGGKAMTDMFVADAMMKGIAKGDSALIRFYMTNQMGFKEKQDVQIENNFTFATLAVPEVNRRLADILTRRTNFTDAPLLENRPVLSVDRDASKGRPE